MNLSCIHREGYATRRGELPIEIGPSSPRHIHSDDHYCSKVKSGAQIFIKTPFPVNIRVSEIEQEGVETRGICLKWQTITAQNGFHEFANGNGSTIFELPVFCLAFLFFMRSDN